jgi:hypothetical protein
MHKKSHSLSGDEHIQQFHNYDHYPEHHDATRTMWWEMGLEEPRGYASGGSVIAQMRAKKLQKLGKHPLHGVPGVHIITADAGEPVFTGEK